MAPADINLSQTRRWLAQLHTTDLPPAPPASSESSMHSRSGSAGDASSPTLSHSTSGGCGIDSSSSSSPATASPLTEARAQSLQRLCEISSGYARNAEAVHARSVNEHFTPNNINYLKTERSDGWSAAAVGEHGQGGSSVPPRKRRSSWARRKSSGQSLEELEGSSLRRFSLSKFKLR